MIRHTVIGKTMAVHKLWLGSEVVNVFKTPAKVAVIPAKAGIQFVHLIDFQGGKPYELDSG
jgi:hypothetical protein